MIMRDNKIKSAVDKLSLSEAAKRRIIDSCETEENTSEKRAPRIRWTLVTAAVLVAALTVGTLAVAGVFRRGIENAKPHIDMEKDIEFNPIVDDLSSDNNREAVSDDGEFILRFNAVTGSEEKIYIDCTLTRKDGGAVTDIITENGTLPQIINTSSGELFLSDGSTSSAAFYALSDSTETAYHIEGMALVARHYSEGDDYDEYRKNKYYSEEEIRELLDGAKVIPGTFLLVTDNSIETFCSFSSGIGVDGNFKNTTLETEFDPVEIVCGNGKLVLHRAHITNTDLRLFGDGEIIDGAGVDDILRAAYVVTDDGTTIPLGRKIDRGTDPLSGETGVGWQCETVLDPEKIAEIHIGDAVIKLK